MSWPIILRRSQSEAVRSATRDFLETLEGEERAVFAIILSQMDRGIALGHEEQELLQAGLIHVLRTSDVPMPDLETGFFRLYGRWVRQPTWWQLERQEKDLRRNA